MKQFFYWFKRKSLQQKYRPVILITGCSSGIGAVLGQLLIKKNLYRVVITARKESLSRLVQLGFKESDTTWIRPLDVTKHNERRVLINEIKDKLGGVDILINNAGISYRAVVEHMPELAEAQQLNTNYLGPMALTRLVLPAMREKGRGKIINVSSVSGMLAMPTMSSYSASKFALEGAMESLWYEMKPLGINVTLVQPGFIKSESFKNVYYTHKSSIAEVSRSDEMPYADYYKNMTPFIEKMMNYSFTSPEEIAKIVFKVIRTENPKLRVAATFDAKVFYYLRRWIPRSLFHKMLFLALPNARSWGKKYSKARALKS